MTDENQTWSRTRLLATLAGVSLMVVALLAGLAWAVFQALRPAEQPDPATTPATATHTVRGEAFRDQLAAAPMLTVPPEAARTPSLSRAVAATLAVPTPNNVGPAGVPSGFGHTPEGAVAQLAAIESVVVEAMSIPVAHEVYRAWALPGGAGPEQWAMTGNVQAFLTAARVPDNARDESVFVTATPVAGQVKGTDGPDWVLACVLLDVRATIVADARIGYGHCERMQWTGDRWLIAPGDPPATAPSTWPGSDLALQAGWRTLTHG